MFDVCLVGWLIVRLIAWLLKFEILDRRVDWHVDCLIGWLIELLHVRLVV